MRVQALDRRVEVQVRDPREGVIVHPEHLQYESRSFTVNDTTASSAARKETSGEHTMKLIMSKSTPNHMGVRVRI